MGFILQKVEESYTILCQRLAGSALTDKHSGVWTLWVSDSRIILPEQSIEWNDLLVFKVKTLWDSVSSLKKKRYLFPNIMHQAEATVCWLGSSSKRSRSCQSPRHPRSVVLPLCKSKRQSCREGVNRGSVAAEAGPPRVLLCFPVSQGPQVVPVFSAAVCTHLPSFFWMRLFRSRNKDVNKVHRFQMYSLC